MPTNTVTITTSGGGGAGKKKIRKTEWYTFIHRFSTMDISNVSSQGKRSKLEKWQAFVDNALMKTGQVTDAAIFGLDGVKWASSKNFNVRRRKTTTTTN